MVPVTNGGTDGNMAGKKKATRAEMIEAALEIVRGEGIDGLNARALAKHLGCSTQPIYFEFENMEEIKAELALMAQQKYQDYVALYMKKSEYKPYKSYGLGFTRFALEERQLFKLLYLKERTEQSLQDFGDAQAERSRETLCKDYGITAEQAAWFHYNMSIYGYGLGVMLNTGFVSLSDDEISKLLDDEFHALIGIVSERGAS